MICFYVAPTELEAVIRTHPGVQDVAVTGIPEDESGELPVAFIVVAPGSSVTAQDIKNLVKGYNIFFSSNYPQALE